MRDLQSDNVPFSWIGKIKRQKTMEVCKQIIKTWSTIPELKTPIETNKTLIVNIRRVTFDLLNLMYREYQQNNKNLLNLLNWN